MSTMTLTEWLEAFRQFAPHDRGIALAEIASHVLAEGHVDPEAIVACIDNMTERNRTTTLDLVRKYDQDSARRRKRGRKKDPMTDFITARAVALHDDGLTWKEVAKHILDEHGIKKTASTFKRMANAFRNVGYRSDPTLFCPQPTKKAA
jgi:hypothetical protein